MGSQHAFNISAWSDRFVFIPSDKRKELVMKSNILYCKADGSYINIYLCDGRCIPSVCRSLSWMEDQLSDGPFMRCSRSYIVNMDMIKEIDTIGCHAFILINDKCIDIADNTWEKLKPVIDAKLKGKPPAPGTNNV